MMVYVFIVGWNLFHSFFLDNLIVTTREGDIWIIDVLENTKNCQPIELQGSWFWLSF